MHYYDTVFNILIKKKHESTAIYNNHKALINIVIAMLDNKIQSDLERVEKLDSIDEFLSDAILLKNQFNYFKCHGVAINNPDSSEAYIKYQSERCVDVSAITSLLNMETQLEINRFWVYVILKMNCCISIIHKQREQSLVTKDSGSFNKTNSCFILFRRLLVSFKESIKIGL